MWVQLRGGGNAPGVGLSGVQSGVSLCCAPARFELENQLHLEQNQRCLFASNTAVQWLDIRLQMIGVAVITAIAGIAIIQHQKELGNPGGLPGIVLSSPLGCGPGVPLLPVLSLYQRSRAPTPCHSACCLQLLFLLLHVPLLELDPRVLTSPLFLCPATEIPALSLTLTLLFMFLSSQDLWAWRSHMPCQSQTFSRASFPASL